MSRTQLRSPCASLWMALALAASLMTPGLARADVVDDAYAEGGQAAAQRDWEAAIEHWSRAAELLPGRSAQLDYDLGTAYAQLGELGPATYHFERALQPQARPSSEVAELARRNLSIVRQRAEIAAETEGSQVAWREGWWTLVVEILAGRALAWIALCCAWLVVAGLGLRLWVARRDGGDAAHRSTRRALGAGLISLALVAALGGVLHGLAYDSVHGTPEAITLEPNLELRQGPGAHLPLAFRVQGGSRVRVLEERSGWTRVRLPAGLEGWAPRDAIARLDQSWVRTRVRAASPTSTGETEPRPQD